MKIKKLLILLLTILIAVPMGVLVAAFAFIQIIFTFPFCVCRNSFRKIELEHANKELEEKHSDIWSKHIKRMAQNEKDLN
jgi:hypothetical protein|tara:strand:- start:1694 stop:1933 length:240 start_codon:yes stop_codon:yes gene_type:complete